MLPCYVPLGEQHYLPDVPPSHCFDETEEADFDVLVPARVRPGSFMAAHRMISYRARLLELAQDL
jgi:hypothetical protein